MSGEEPIQSRTFTRGGRPGRGRRGGGGGRGRYGGPRDEGAAEAGWQPEPPPPPASCGRQCSTPYRPPPRPSQKAPPHILADGGFVRPDLEVLSAASSCLSRHTSSEEPPVSRKLAAAVPRWTISSPDKLRRSDQRCPRLVCSTVLTICIM